MNMRIHHGEPLTVGHHDAKFGGFRYCGRGDKTFLNCYMISKDHVFKELPNFVGGSPL